MKKVFERHETTTSLYTASMFLMIVPAIYAIYINKSDKK